MNYEETLEYLYSQLPMFQRIGAAAYKANLDNTYALMEVLNQPQKKFKSVHIAGTNGKGSTAHMLASIYQEAGYKTGLYTSPHLKDFRERIRINGEMISKEFVIDFVAKYSEKFMPISPSFFELTMAMAFQYFVEEKVDIVILETGMGGRLDSTNIVKPELTIITNIGMDHTQFLGDTLPKIAAEKAGIIKEDIPVLIGERQDETKAVFAAKANESNSFIHYAEDLIGIKKLHTADEFFAVFNGNKLMFKNLNFPLKGNYQINNLKTALAASVLLEIPIDAVQRGIEKVLVNTNLTGRWQVLSQNPLTICDTGHNEAGIRYVVEQLKNTPHKTLHFVLGVVNDKAIEYLLEMLPKNAIYYFCKADIPRGLEIEILQEKAKKAGLIGTSFSSVPIALLEAQKAALEGDLVFVGGSTFTVAEVV